MDGINVNLKLFPEDENPEETDLGTGISEELFKKQGKKMGDSSDIAGLLAQPEIKEQPAPDGRIFDTDEPPLIVDLSNIGADDEIEVMSKFQHVNPGFFAQKYEAALSINGRVVSVNAAAVRLFPEVDYMELLVNSEDCKVALEPSNELNLSAYKWAKEKNGKRYSTQRTGLPFVLCICQLMGWDPNNRYRIFGKKVPNDVGEHILVFDLKTAQEFKKPQAEEKGNSRSTILTGWDGTFGPTYHEGGQSLSVDKFDKYTVFSIKEGYVSEKNNEQKTDGDES